MARLTLARVTAAAFFAVGAGAAIVTMIAFVRSPPSGPLGPSQRAVRRWGAFVAILVLVIAIIAYNSSDAPAHLTQSSSTATPTPTETPTSTETPTRTPTPSPSEPYIRPSRAAVRAGGRIVIDGGGFKPGEQVFLQLQWGGGLAVVATLATPTASSQGTFKVTVKIPPCNLPGNACFLTAKGALSGLSAKVDIDIIT